MSQIDTLRKLLQTNESQNEILFELVEQCSAEYLSRTHQTEVDEAIVNAMVIERFNRLGNEGVQTFSYSGITESFESDYSEAVQKLIRSKARMVTL